VEFCEETTCFAPPAYLEGRGPFDDFIVHEAAHVVCNWKRAYAGLPASPRREWLLEIAFEKREVFAYSCEVYSRIVEQCSTVADRMAMLKEYSQAPFIDGTSIFLRRPSAAGTGGRSSSRMYQSRFASKGDPAELIVAPL
jgi:hypothetical protein